MYCYYWIPRVLVFMNRIYEFLSAPSVSTKDPFGSSNRECPMTPTLQSSWSAAAPSLKLRINFVELQGFSIVTAEKGPKVQRV